MVWINNVMLDHGRLGREDIHLVDSVRPVFSWSAVSDTACDHQSACHVRVWASDAVLWDSGWVERSEQSLRYGGAPLPEGEPAEFSIAIRNRAGEESEEEKGSLVNARVDWRAPFIGAPEDERGRTVYLRREFEVRRPLRSARLYVCGLGYALPYLDDEQLSVTSLTPAPTDYTKTCLYVLYHDLRQLLEPLKPGPHRLVVLLGEGWRRNAAIDMVEKGGRKIPYAGPPALSAMLCLCYEDGEEEWILTDERWEAGYGAHARNDLFDGEVYDARLNEPDTLDVCFHAVGPAAQVPAPGGVMRPMVIPQIWGDLHHDPIASWPLDGALMLDFGRNIAGVVSVGLPRRHLAPGQTVRLRHAELLDEGGDLYRAALRSAKAEDTYIAAGDRRDKAIWSPKFTYHGFRYVRVDGLGEAVYPYNFAAWEEHTAIELRSSFRCGSALATKIHENCVATERANMHGILTDCPQRDERQGWMNDATVRFEATPYNFDVGRMFTKVVRDIIDAQSSEGSISCTAPFVFGSNPADPVCSSFLVAGWQAFLHTGNVDLVREAFPAWCAWEDYLLSRSQDYIVDYSYYGDWAGPEYACEQSPDPTPRSTMTPGVFMSTGYSYYNCALLVKFAEVLGDDAAAAKYRDLGDSVREAMLKKWYDPASGKVATGSQGCQAFALWLDILPEEGRAAAAKVMRDDLVDSGYRMTTGNLCSRYLLTELARSGYLDEAWTLFTREEYPSFGYMIQNEATTVWERFELKKDPGMNSHCHPMYAAADQWLYASIAGIVPTAPGFVEADIHPHLPAGLLSAQASVDTVKGELFVRWVRQYGLARLFVKVPFGVTARVTFGGEARTVGSGFYAFEAPDDGRAIN